MCRHEHGRGLHFPCERQELLTQGVCRLQLSASEIITPQSTKHGEKLRRVFQVFTEVPSTRVDLTHFRSRIALRGLQRYTQGEQHVHFALDALTGLGQCLEQL